MLQSFLISGSRSFLSPGPTTVPSPPSPSLSLLSPPLLPSSFSGARLPIPKGIRGPRPELPPSALTEGKTVFSFFSSLSNCFPDEVAEKTRNEEQRGQMKSWGQAERLQRHLCLRLPEKACGAGEWGLDAGSGIWDFLLESGPNTAALCQDAMHLSSPGSIFFACEIEVMTHPVFDSNIQPLKMGFGWFFGGFVF